MSAHRIEKDLLGEMDAPCDALYGIHTIRANTNFVTSGRRVNSSLIRAYGAVKLAAAEMNHDIDAWPDDTFRAIKSACTEMMDGLLDQHITVDALQGGAGTSTNMNVNEVLANRALQLLGKTPGEYATISPISDINKSQSTNDTYPTALSVAAISGIRALEKALVALMEALQKQEKVMAHVVKAGRTQLQDAVLTTMGRTMASFADAIGRDRWRVYKCEERLRVVNLGGTAIGSGLGAPRRYIFGVVDKLKAITGMGLTRAENLTDATQNLDVLVEVSGILTACATNLMKICGDLRLMASGPDAGLGELTLPALQAGSSIMPGKVNPVIPEAVIQAAIKVQGNHTVISQACAMGNLELNAFLPLIAETLLESIDLLHNSAMMLATKCIDGLVVNEDGCRRGAQAISSMVTALVPYIGYQSAQEVGALAKSNNISVREAVVRKGLMAEEDLERVFRAESVLRLGDPEVSQ